MKITELIVDTEREDHIARHHISVAEVYEVALNPASLARRVRDNRYIITGQTLGGRYLSVFIAPRNWVGVYGLVTARDADDKERRAYQRHRGY